MGVVYVTHLHRRERLAGKCLALVSLSCGRGNGGPLTRLPSLRSPRIPTRA